MKFISYILIAIIGFLIVQPSVELISVDSSEECVMMSCGNECCCTPQIGNDQSDSDEDQDSRKQEHKGTCNPFSNCGFCAIVMTVPQTLIIEYNETAREPIDILSPGVIPGFLSDLFRPPQSV